MSYEAAPPKAVDEAMSWKTKILDCRQQFAWKRYPQLQNFKTSSTSKLPIMKRFLLILSALLPLMAWCQMPEYRHRDRVGQDYLDSLSRSSLWHCDYEIEQLVTLYYNDFLALEPYYSHCADSALKYLKLLYDFDYSDCNYSQNNRHLYYPIVQVETALGVGHDPAISPQMMEEGSYFPNDYFLPCDLGDWQHSRTLDLLTIMESSQRKAESISSLLRAMSLPNLRDSAMAEADTVFRIIHWGNWGWHTVVSFQHETDGMWRVYLHRCDHLGLGIPGYRSEIAPLVSEIADSADLADLRRLAFDTTYQSLPTRCFTGHVPDGGSYTYEWRINDRYKVIAADYWGSISKDKSARKVQAQVKKRYETFMRRFDGDR